MLSKHCGNHFTVFMCIYYIIMLELPCSSNGKEFACNARDLGSGRSPGEKNGYPLQNSCLEKSMDRGAWRTTDDGVAKSQTH